MKADMGHELGHPVLYLKVRRGHLLCTVFEGVMAMAKKQGGVTYTGSKMLSILSLVQAQPRLDSFLGCTVDEDIVRPPWFL